MLKLNEELQEKISYILIGIILLSYIVPIFSGMGGGFILIGQLIAVFCLAGFYAAISEKKDLIFLIFLLFALQQVSVYAMYVSNEAYVYIIFIILSKLPIILSALVFGILAYKHSKEFKAFESLEFLLVLLLLITPILELFNPVLKEYSKYFLFGICFLIATLMYNNNMWMRYKDNEKNLLVFLLLATFINVIQVSAKFITF